MTGKFAALGSNGCIASSVTAHTLAHPGTATKPTNAVAALDGADFPRRRRRQCKNRIDHPEHNEPLQRQRYRRH